ncbi:MAG: deoxyribose-phosphate aldolase [bacterium]
MKDQVREILEKYRKAEDFHRPQPPFSLLPQFIDHTLLKPEASEEDVLRLCREAIKVKFYSVCLHPCWVPIARKELGDSGVQLGTVVGFPLGANSSDTKLEEALWCAKQGATEIDMVMNIGFLKSGHYNACTEEITRIVEKTRLPIKVIIETCLLTEEEKVLATLMVAEAGAAFVKTSTGFSAGGATVEDVRLLRFAAQEKLKVKASGGIRTLTQALEMIQAGADRIGTSSGIKIIEEAKGAPV